MKNRRNWQKLKPDLRFCIVFMTGTQFSLSGIFIGRNSSTDILCNICGFRTALLCADMLQYLLHGDTCFIQRIGKLFKLLSLLLLQQSLKLFIQLLCPVFQVIDGLLGFADSFLQRQLFSSSRHRPVLLFRRRRRQASHERTAGTVLWHGSYRVHVPPRRRHSMFPGMRAHWQQHVPVPV